MELNSISCAVACLAVTLLVTALVKRQTSSGYGPGCVNATRPRRPTGRCLSAVDAEEDLTAALAAADLPADGEEEVNALFEGIEIPVETPVPVVGNRRTSLYVPPQPDGSANAAPGHVDQEDSRSEDLEEALSQPDGANSDFLSQDEYGSDQCTVEVLMNVIRSQNEKLAAVEERLAANGAPNGGVDAQSLLSMLHQAAITNSSGKDRSYQKSAMTKALGYLTIAPLDDDSLGQMFPWEEWYKRLQLGLKAQGTGLIELLNPEKYTPELAEASQQLLAKILSAFTEGTRVWDIAMTAQQKLGERADLVVGAIEEQVGRGSLFRSYKHAGEFYGDKWLSTNDLVRQNLFR